MKLWVDDVRPAPKDYLWLKTVDGVIAYLQYNGTSDIELMDLDHDAGDYAAFGGDYIKILNWMEGNDIDAPPIHLHTMNPVGVMRMRHIIQHNHWTEVR